MKKIFFIISFLFVFFSIDCYAWLGPGKNSHGQNYNYEVTSFNINQNGVGSISGWAILNAGAKDGASPKLNKAKQSGGGTARSRKKCNGSDDSNTYLYTLDIYSVKKSGSSYKEVAKVKSYGPVVGNHSLDLTYEMCSKNSSGTICGPNFSSMNPCYDNVGFSFNFDLSGVSNSYDGYKFKLTVKSQRGNYFESFDLSFDMSVVDDSSLKFVDAKTFLNKLKLAVIEGRPWQNPGNLNGTKCKGGGNWLDGSRDSNTYTFDDVYNNGYIVWYKLNRNGNNCANWVPASWVFSASTVPTVTVPSNPPENVDTTCKNNILSEDKMGEVNSCDGSYSTNLNTGRTCAMEVGGSYYNISCNPENIKVNFKPDSFGTLYSGQGFSYDVEIVSERTCKGIFYADKWNDSYDKVIYGLNYYQSRINSGKYKGTELDNYKKNYNEYKNKLVDLVNMVKTYNEYMNEVLNEYTMNPNIQAKLYQIERKNGSVIKEKVIDTLKFDSINIIDKGLGVVKKTKTNKLNVTNNVLNKYGISISISNPSDFTYSNSGSPKKGVISLSKSYINRHTGEVSNKNYSGNSEWIDAGNKYYTSLHLDEDYTYNIRVTISELGALKNLTVANNHCEFSVDNRNNLLYRHIDLSDPFVHNSNHIIGKNWSNIQYNFTGVIKTNVWKNEPLYKFNINKKELVEIKESNGSITGSTEYLGVCHNNEYRDTDIVCKILNGVD